MAKATRQVGGFVQQLGSLVLALVLGVVVWVNATYEADPPLEDVFGTPIPIQALNLEKGLVVTNNPTKTTEVEIRAFTSSWDRLSAASFRATADLGGLDPGIHRVPVEVTCVDETVDVIGARPDTLYVELEPLMQRTMTVTAELLDVDALPLGYSAEVSGISPATVELHGAESRVDQVVNVIAGVSLAEAREPAVVEVDLVAVGPDGEAVEGVNLLPDAVNVSYDIARRFNYREVAVRSRTEGTPARGYFVSNVRIEPDTVTLVGPPAVIAEMAGVVSTKGLVDISGATRMVAERLPLDLPEGVSVLSETEGTLEQVLITVEIDPVMGGTTLEVPLITRKRSPDLIAELSVSSVDVILTGPAVILDELQTELIQAFVDVGGLGPGTHQLLVEVAIAVEQNPRLADLVINNVAPTFVEVTLRPVPTPTPEPTLTLTPMATPTVTPVPTATLVPTLTPTPTSTPR
ncbi:MAG: CdaR family protein [Anaerolineae bacterium]